MKRTKIHANLGRIDDTSFEELYDGISQDWEGKAQRLQARRWRKIKHQLI